MRGKYLVLLLTTILFSAVLMQDASATNRPPILQLFSGIGENLSPHSSDFGLSNHNSSS
jgi:hypothetical protein